MKYAPACISLAFATTFMGGCATRPPAPERPYLVQLSVAYSDGPCDWSLMQDVNSRPMLSGPLGGAWWPHTVPTGRKAWRAREAPLLAFGATAGSLTFRAVETVCLPLYKRAQVRQEGILPPVVGLSLTSDGAHTRVLGQSFDPGLAGASIMIHPYKPRGDFPPQRLDLQFHHGQAEGQLPPLPLGQSALITVVATMANGEAQTNRAMDVLVEGGLRPQSIERDGSRLVARPW